MPEDRLLTVRELAEYMQVQERTVLRLAASGALPGVKLANQWRFKRDVIDAWLAERMGTTADGEDLPIEEYAGGVAMPLTDILSETGVLHDCHAKDRVSVIEELAARAFSNGWITDKTWFVGALGERESLCSTAVEGGVAFLHTRRQNARKIARPFIVVGRSWHGVDFAAPDGKPTFLFFLLGLKYDRLHLPVLGRLARVLRDPAVVSRLRAAPTASRIRDLLLQEDARFLAAAATRS